MSGERGCEGGVQTFKVDLSVPVRVEDVDDSLDQRILLQFRQGHELVYAQGAGVVQVQLAEPFTQPFNFVRVNCSHSGGGVSEGGKDPASGRLTRRAHLHR